MRRSVRGAARLTGIRPEARFACVGHRFPEYVRSLRHLPQSADRGKRSSGLGELVEELPVVGWVGGDGRTPEREPAVAPRCPGTYPAALVRSTSETLLGLL